MAFQEPSEGSIASDVFHQHYKSLSQSMTSPDDVVAISRSLYRKRYFNKKVLQEIISSETPLERKKDALLAAIGEAVSADHRKLHELATVLDQFKETKPVANKIISDFNDLKIVKRAAREAVKKNIVDLKNAISATFEGIILSCEQENLISSDFKTNLLDDSSTANKATRCSNLITHIHNLVGVQPAHLDTFLCILNGKDLLASEVANSVANSYGYNLPKYEKIRGVGGATSVVSSDDNVEEMAPQYDQMSNEDSTGDIIDDRTLPKHEEFEINPCTVGVPTSSDENSQPKLWTSYTMIPSHIKRLEAETNTEEQGKLNITAKVILYGPPGVGKTLFRRRLTRESQIVSDSPSGTSSSTSSIFNNTEFISAILNEDEVHKALPVHSNSAFSKEKGEILLQIIDVGGQPEFYDILPLLLTGPALYLLFFNLTQDLETPYNYSYQRQSGSLSTTYDSQFNVLHILHQILSSIALSSHGDSDNSAAIIIGTFLDKLRENCTNLGKDLQVEIIDVDEHLKSQLKGHAYYTEFLKKCPKVKQNKADMFFPVDNVSGTIEEIKPLCDIIKRTLNSFKSSFPTNSASFCCRLQDFANQNNDREYCTLDEARELAKGLQFVDKVEKVLTEIHNKFGSVLYYDDVCDDKGVKYVFCNPNVILKLVNQLVAVCLGSNLDHQSITEELLEKGTVTLDHFNKLCNSFSDGIKDGSMLRYVTKLLTRIRIISKISNTHLFIPCLLKVSTDTKYTPNPSEEVAPLLFKLSSNEKTNFPPGLFLSMVVRLSMMSGWKLASCKHFKNKFCFSSSKSESISVELIAQPHWIEVRLNSKPSSLAPSPNRIWKDIEVAINDIRGSNTLLANFLKSIELEVGFYCPESALDQLHFAKKINRTQIACQACDQTKVKFYPIDSKHQIWFEDGSTMETTTCNHADEDLQVSSLSQKILTTHSHDVAKAITPDLYGSVVTELRARRLIAQHTKDEMLATVQQPDSIKLLNVLEAQLANANNPEKYLINICSLFLKQRNKQLSDITHTILSKLEVIIEMKIDEGDEQKRETLQQLLEIKNDINTNPPPSLSDTPPDKQMLKQQIKAMIMEIETLKSQLMKSKEEREIEATREIEMLQDRLSEKDKQLLIVKEQLREKGEEHQLIKEKKKLETEKDDLLKEILQKNEIIRISQLRIPTIHDDWLQSPPEPVPVIISMKSIANESRFSPSFLSGPNGYKMCLKVEKQRNHLNICVHLMAGDWDDELQWPFKGEVILELINRRSDSGHYRQTICLGEQYNQEACQRVVNGIPTRGGITNRMGQGGLEFIRARDLQYNMLAGTEYLRDSTIRICVCEIKVDQNSEQPFSLSLEQITEFKVVDFSAKKKANAECISEPFYSHEGGYKFALLVYPNGCDTHKGQSVSAYIHLSKGENDGRLQFPFRGEFIVQILNVNEDKYHVEQKIVFSDETDPDGKYGARVSGILTWFWSNRSFVGFGLPDFLSHQHLEHHHQAQYLKDDTITFRVARVNPTFDI